MSQNGGNGPQRHWGGAGTGKIENKDFDSGEQGLKRYISGEEGNRYPREGLNSMV